MIFDSKTGSETYRLIKDTTDNGNLCYKKWIEKLWRKFEPYALPDFLKNFQNDDENFFSLTWEMLLVNKLLRKGFKILPNINSNAPDICIGDKSGKKIWIECCIAYCKKNEWLLQDVVNVDCKEP